MTPKGPVPPDPNSVSGQLRAAVVNQIQLIADDKLQLADAYEFAQFVQRMLIRVHKMELTLDEIRRESQEQELQKRPGYVGHASSGYAEAGAVAATPPIPTWPTPADFRDVQNHIMDLRDTAIASGQVVDLSLWRNRKR